MTTDCICVSVFAWVIHISYTNGTMIVNIYADYYADLNGLYLTPSATYSVSTSGYIL